MFHVSTFKIINMTNTNHGCLFCKKFRNKSHHVTFKKFLKYLSNSLSNQSIITKNRLKCKGEAPSAADC